MASLSGFQSTGLYKNKPSAVTDFSIDNQILYGLPWTPSAITTVMWFDASDTSTVTVVDNKVSLWANKSNNGFHAVENTASSRPPYGTNKLNNMNLLSIRASSIGMTTAYNLTTPYSITLVCNSSGGGRVIQSASTNSLIDPTRGGNAFYVNGDVRSAPLTSAGTWSIITLYVTGASASQLWYQGGNHANGSTHSHWGTFAIGTRGQYNENPNSDIAEIIVHKQTLTTDLRQRIEGYLAHKWNLKYTLEGAHPYKVNLPLNTTSVGGGGKQQVNNFFIPRNFNQILGGINRAQLIFEADASNSASYSGSGTLWKDLGSASTNGELIASPTFNGNTTQKSFTFNGSTSYARFPESNILNVQTITVESWFKTSNILQNGFLFEKGQVNTQYSLFLQGNLIVWRQMIGGTITNLTAVSTNILTANKWTQLACTITANGARRIYANGQLIAEDLTPAGAITTNSNGMSIGVYGGYNGARSYFFNGQIASCRVWSRELTANEIATNYLHGQVTYFD